MCELKAVLERGEGNRDIVMDSTTRVIVEGDEIELTGIFGERENVQGSIKEINFSKGELIILGND
ncbi:CooT family nickel-binding protein [Methanohalophilus sp. RSK]|uniref:CooT family nickel-binding protein n=1 Tax=Methanohalophilus sp. RSK TaxID=2485783 RepID=UPI000F43C0E5|nr:CooT family nickel-binding protein [Methanohalophilus sp. RSK]RNI12483.1 CooT family nickel-binding protein [Methanohalophilus sp. RSK]